MSLSLTHIPATIKAIATMLNTWKASLELKFNPAGVGGGVLTVDMAAKAIEFSKVGDDVGQDFCISFSVMGVAAGAGWNLDYAFVPPKGVTLTLKRLMMRCYNNNAATRISGLVKHDGGWVACLTGALTAGGYGSTNVTDGVTESFAVSTIDEDEPFRFNLVGDGTETHVTVVLWCTAKVSNI